MRQVADIHHSRCMFVTMTVQEAAYYSIEQLKNIYEEGEAIAISNLVMEHITGYRVTDANYKKDNLLTDEQTIQLKKIAERLRTHEPVQYVLNESWFYGYKFYVDKNVLIPRPETEELVDWIIKDCKFPIHELKILDIGTGSGCIPVILKRKLRKAEVWTCDVSAAAIEIAKKNAVSLGTTINLIPLDFLDTEQWKQLPSVDIIVSNPPYIPAKDAVTMDPNVTKFEPPVALFVPDNDPLIFYKAIAAFGKKHLNKNGSIYFEIHEDLGGAAIQMLQSNNYTTELRKDMQGKERMIKAVCS